eukprot:9179272-Pyramimonas_sp.AAC.1
MPEVIDKSSANTDCPTSLCSFPWSGAKRVTPRARGARLTLALRGVRCSHDGAGPRLPACAS